MTTQRQIEAALTAFFDSLCRAEHPSVAQRYAMQAALEAAEAAAWEPARPLEEWHEDIGPVLWWRFPITEPPYVGTPLDNGHLVIVNVTAHRAGDNTMRVRVGGWPGYHTHWTPLPPLPAPPRGT